MTRYHATIDGDIPFTHEEEIEWDAKEAASAIPTIAEYTNAVQHQLDAWAQTRNYDGILSLCTYATSSNPRFAVEGQRGVDVRDDTWADCYTIMADVQAGNRPPPSVEQLLSELPVPTWPA